MADPARTDSIPELPSRPPETDDGPVLDDQQVLDFLEEGSDPAPPADAPKGIAIAMGLGALIWLGIFAVYLVLT